MDSTQQPAPAGEARRDPGPEEVRDATMRLPERQREALALRERELSYEEIGAAMGMSSGSVAHLISLARINLYDELRGTPLASVAAPSPECERALPAIAAREDGQLDAISGDEAWLDDHMAGCDRCRLAVEQMEEAAIAHRAGAPIAVVAAPLGESGAKAAEADGDSPARPPSQGRGGPRFRRAVLAATLAAALLLGGLVAVLIGDDGASAPPRPAAEAAAGRVVGGPSSGAGTAKAGKGSGDAAKKRAKGEAGDRAAATASGEAAPASAAGTAPIASGGAPSGHSSGPNRSSGKAAVEPTQQTAATKPSSKTKAAPTSTQASQPASQPTTAAPTEEPPPAEEPSDEPGKRAEAPGKHVGRQPQ
jgi:Sigma-70, region 4